MRHALRDLNRATLASLTEALRSGHIRAPITRSMLAGYVPLGQLDAVLAALSAMEREGMTPRHIAHVVGMLAEERLEGQRMSDRVQFVWSPPELDRIDSRDTAVVVQDLFVQARSSVLIATFAIDKQQRARALFAELAAKMDAEPQLAVRVFANIHHPERRRTSSFHKTTPPPTPTPAQLAREFGDKVRREIWPGRRLPDFYYDPRSLSPDAQHRAVLHAKVVVVDARYTLLTSANFTEAAQRRNIEAGVLIDDPRLATRLTQQFDKLVEASVFAPVPV
jgi:phosphatidylserine/phosphatidylglycerophosphate/cardiolipin synthase-like enzyme